MIQILTICEKKYNDIFFDTDLEALQQDTAIPLSEQQLQLQQSHLLPYNDFLQLQLNLV